MAQLTINDITNLYLYGQKTTPTNLVDNNLIRPKDIVTRVEVQVKELMETGAGRFAVGSQFQLIQKFFDPNISIPANTYNKFQINDLILQQPLIVWSMQQFNYDDGVDDYLDRVWVYNSMAFKISDGVEFIVEEDGDRRINNFAIEPFIPSNPNDIENFDFSSNDLVTIFANTVVLPSIDPSGIGRKVFIDFVRADLLPRITYDKQSFSDDLQRSQSWNVSTPAALARLVSVRDEFVDGLFNDGVTKFLDGNKPILYGKPGDDLLLTAAYLNSSLNYPTLNPFKDNGVVLIGGTGADNIIGASKDDKLLGGQGADRLRSNDGSDTLDGGEGNDTLNGGLGDDTFIGGAGDDMMIGGSFLFGLFEGTDTSNYRGALADYDVEFLPDDSIRIIDKVGGRDGSDMLEGVDIAVFSDKSINLGPGQDIAFVIDTTGSMFDDIDAVKARSNDIINAIFDGDRGFLDSRIAVVGYNDPGTNTFLSFTDQPKIDDRKTAAINAINSISVGGGGDIPELVNAGLIRALSGDAGEWRSEAIARRIILFGDAPPKDTELRDTVLRLAADVGAEFSNRAVPLSIAGDIETSSLTSGLAVTRFNITVADENGTPTTIPVEIFTVLIGNDPTTRNYFQSIAAATGGQAFTAANASEVVDALIEALGTPIAVNDSGIGFSTDEDNSFTTANVLNNDRDPDSSDILSITSFDTSGTTGLVTYNGDGTFDYDPNSQFEFLSFGESATDNFTYTISDSNGNTNTATVTIAINGVDGVNVINGTPDNNRLLGTVGANLIRAGGGQDLL